MKLVIDDKIPFIRGFAERMGEAVYLPGAAISAADVRDADALIVRTRTRCNRELLEGSRVKFIATATIGYDHIDTEYLRQAGIAWTNCPGCNAASVAQYVRNSLLLLAAHGCWDGCRPLTAADGPVLPADLDRSVFSRLTLAIVGVGHVGTKVLEMARQMGFKRILLCDPPRAEREGTDGFSTLDEVAAQADVVTFHTPLTRSPQPHATFHMANAAFFQKLRSGAVVFNTSRGEVVCTEALQQAMEQGKVRAAVIDTWENEPHVSPWLLSHAFLATPHIAGYSADGKANGTRMALQAVARHFGLPCEEYAQVLPPTLPVGFNYCEGTVPLCEELRLYNPLRDSLALKTEPEKFESLRGNYPLRRER